MEVMHMKGVGDEGEEEGAERTEQPEELYMTSDRLRATEDVDDDDDTDEEEKEEHDDYDENGEDTDDEDGDTSDDEGNIYYNVAYTEVTYVDRFDDEECMNDYDEEMDDGEEGIYDLRGDTDDSYENIDKSWDEMEL